MVHQYQLNGYNIVLDTCSGAIHAVDEVAYDIIARYPDKTADQIVEELLAKYADRPDVTEEELRTLRDKGLTMVYMGLESGCDDVLKRMRKGHTAAAIVAAGQKAKRCGLTLSVTAISGLGSVELWQQHALDTARAVSEMKPDYLGLLTLMVPHGTPLEGWVKDGSFTVLGPLEVLKETELFLQHVDSEGTVFRANHASNYLTLKGTLNGDREALLAQIRAALEGRRDLKPEFLRAL